MSIDLRANVNKPSKEEEHPARSAADGTTAMSLDGDSKFTLVSTSNVIHKAPSTTPVPTFIKNLENKKRSTTCSGVESRAFEYTDDLCGNTKISVPDMLQAYFDAQEYRSLHGDSSPWWDVLDLPEEEQLDFYHQGLVLAKRMVELFKGEGLLADDWVSGAKALDFGCGLGRMSNALVALGFPKVVCVDEKPKFLEAAHERLTKFAGKGVVIPDFAQKVEFVQSAPDLLCVQQPSSVDFVHSILQLEHMKPLVQAAYIEQFCDVLRPGGAGFFQIVTSMPIANKTSHCNLAAEHDASMIHYIPKDEVVRHLKLRGCNVLSASGPHRAQGTSMHIIFEKSKSALV